MGELCLFLMDGPLKVERLYWANGSNYLTCPSCWQTLGSPIGQELEISSQEDDLLVNTLYLVSRLEQRGIIHEIWPKIWQCMYL